MKVINYDRNGRIIPDMTKVVIKHDDFPMIWESAARIAEARANEKEKRNEAV